MPCKQANAPSPDIPRVTIKPVWLGVGGSRSARAPAACRKKPDAVGVIVPVDPLTDRAPTSSSPVHGPRRWILSVLEQAILALGQGVGQPIAVAAEPPGMMPIWCTANPRCFGALAGSHGPARASHPGHRLPSSRQPRGTPPAGRTLFVASPWPGRPGQRRAHRRTRRWTRC